MILELAAGNIWYSYDKKKKKNADKSGQQQVHDIIPEHLSSLLLLFCL